MTDILAPGTGIFFMRVGIHARESLQEIFARKSAEIDKVGYTFWGYGGSSCHPVTIVQPFAKQRAMADMPVFLCMEEMTSEHYFGEPLAAAEFSEDGRVWQAVPDEIRVLGSRYALKIRNLRVEAFDLPLEDTRIPVGTSSGRSGDHFVRDRIDKACLVVEPGAGLTRSSSHRQISLIADILSPYAMLLRGFREQAL